MSTLKRRCRNKIIALKGSSGNWVSNNEQLQELIVHYYQSLYATSNTTSYKAYNTTNYNTISQADATKLFMSVTGQEIIDDVHSFQP